MYVYTYVCLRMDGDVFVLVQERHKARLWTRLSADLWKMEKYVRPWFVSWLSHDKYYSELNEHLDTVYGDSSQLMAIAKNFFIKFLGGRKSVFNEPYQAAQKQLRQRITCLFTLNSKRNRLTTSIAERSPN